MKLKIVQAGEAVLRERARPLSKKEIASPAIQQLIEWMRETMYDAPGVGLAAPQVGLPLQLAVIEDRAAYLKSIPPERLEERRRRPVPFQVLINPQVTTSGGLVDFFEGCLSIAGWGALVPRYLEAQVECLDHNGNRQTFRAEGWHARIVQHEVDHLHGNLYIDKMRSRTFTTNDNLARHWADLTAKEVLARVGKA